MELRLRRTEEDIDAEQCFEEHQDMEKWGTRDVPTYACISVCQLSCLYFHMATQPYITAPYFSACLPIYPWSRTDTLNSHLLLYQFAHLAIQSCGCILYTTHLLTHVAL